VTEDEEEARQLDTMGLEAIVACEIPRGIEAAEILLRAFDIEPARIERWVR
jgi:hypothetical protein